mmetsp:Transcript_19638/g.26952  ORF Transcript_19638/g.26952 Transcript_19638/m.26952 type:complete len:544 (-) Transcript_19638:166-1797(-)
MVESNKFDVFGVLNGSHEYIDEFAMMSSSWVDRGSRVRVSGSVGREDLAALDEAVGLAEVEVRVKVHILGLHAVQEGVHLQFHVPDEVCRGPLDRLGFGGDGGLELTATPLEPQDGRHLGLVDLLRVKQLRGEALVPARLPLQREVRVRVGGEDLLEVQREGQRRVRAALHVQLAEPHVVLFLGDAVQEECLRAGLDLDDLAVKQGDRGLGQLQLLLQGYVLAGLVDRVDHQHAVDKQAPALALRRRHKLLREQDEVARLVAEFAVAEGQQRPRQHAAHVLRAGVTEELVLARGGATLVRERHVGLRAVCTERSQVGVAGKGSIRDHASIAAVAANMSRAGSNAIIAVIVAVDGIVRGRGRDGGGGQVEAGEVSVVAVTNMAIGIPTHPPIATAALVGIPAATRRGQRRRRAVGIGRRGTAVREGAAAVRQEDVDLAAVVQLRHLQTVLGSAETILQWLAERHDALVEKVVVHGEAQLAHQHGVGVVCNFGDGHTQLDIGAHEGNEDIGRLGDVEGRQLELLGDAIHVRRVVSGRGIRIGVEA